MAKIEVKNLEGAKVGDIDLGMTSSSASRSMSTSYGKW